MAAGQHGSTAGKCNGMWRNTTHVAPNYSNIKKEKKK